MKNAFFVISRFSVGDETDIDTNKFFKDSNGLAKLMEEILNKYADHLPIYYTGNICRCFRKYKRVNRSEHERGANEFNNILEYEGVNCCIPSGNACFLKWIDFFSRKYLAWSVSNSYNQIKVEQLL